MRMRKNSGGLLTEEGTAPAGFLTAFAVTLCGVLFLPQMLLPEGRGLGFSNSFLSVTVFLLAFPQVRRGLRRGWQGAESIVTLLLSFGFVLACVIGSRLEAQGYLLLTDWRLWVSLPVLTLFFAAHRWGNGGAFDYEADAQQILKDIMSKDGSQGIYNMFNTDSRLISFVPSYGSWLHTDPSYNLPAFLELWAMWTDTNKDFWAQTPGAARQLLADASHPVTGLFPDYSTFDGKPFQPEWKHDYDARRYQYDAMRCAMNVGMDCHWFGKDSLRQRAMMTRLLTFFKNDNFAHGHFNWDGSDPSGTYTAGMVGANAVGAFCLDDKALAAEYVRRLWDTKPPTGRFRYYDGMVYMLSMLHVAGRFRIY